MHDSDEPSSHNQARPHYAPLDGLRGLAIFAVFWHHYGAPPLWDVWWGWTGVDLFFVLSGFLITGILFDTLHSPNYFRNFYIRRSLRIFPLYFGLWLAVILTVPLFHSNWSVYRLAWPAYLGNLTTIHALRTGLDPTFYQSIHYSLHSGGIYYFPTGHFWSLCVEEQYYLLWPLVVWFVRDRKRLMRVCAVGMIVDLALRIGLRYWLPEDWLHTDLIHKLMITRLDTLLAGGFLALWARGRHGLASIRDGYVYAAGFISLSLFCVEAIHTKATAAQDVSLAWIDTYGYTLVAIVCSAILVASLKQKWVAGLLTNRPLRELGKISYGFYVLHMLLHSTRELTHSRAWVYAQNIFAFVFTLVLSWLSYKYFEQPFLRMKNRLAPQDERPLPVAFSKMVESS